MGFLLQEDLCDCPQKDNNQILVQVESTAFIAIQKIYELVRIRTKCLCVYLP